MCFIITGTLPKDVDLDEARGVEGPEAAPGSPSRTLTLRGNSRRRSGTFA